VQGARACESNDGSEFGEELKQRRYWLEHLRAAHAQGALAEYARVAQAQSDTLYRWWARFERKGVSIDEEPGTALASFAAVRVATAGTGRRSGIGRFAHIRSLERTL